MKKLKYLTFILTIIGFQFSFCQTELTIALLNSTVNQNDIIVIQYYDKDCNACKFAMPDYQKLAKKYESEITFYQVDITKSSIDFGVSVTPTYRIIAGAGNFETLEGASMLNYLTYILHLTLKEKNENGLKTDNTETKLKNLVQLNKDVPSSKELLLKINGGFEDPGSPDEFQVYYFCEQIREDTRVFGFNTEKVFIKYMSEKLLGISTGYENKKVSDEPYSSYLKKYLHKLKCDTSELSSFSLRETNSFFKHIVDLGRPDYFGNFYFSRCVPDDSKPGINVNSFEIVNGEKETLLDFVEKVLEHRLNDPTRKNQSQDDFKKLHRELIKYCGAKNGSDL